MKKLKVLSLVAAAAGMVVLTSCMKGNSEFTRTDFGVVETSTKTYKKVVYPYGFYPVFLPSVEKDFTIDDGDCVWVNYKINQEQSENVNASAYGYYTATDDVVGMVMKPKNEIDTRPDTSIVKPKEMLLKNSSVMFVGSEKFKRMIVQGVPTSYLKDQKNDYSLSCDLYQEPQTIGNTERVYTLFLRTTLETPGQAPTIENGADLNAFRADYFYNSLHSREKAAGKNAVYFVVKYPIAFNSDSTKITEWKTSELAGFPIITESN